MAITKKVALPILIVFLLIASLMLAFAQTEENVTEAAEAETSEADQVAHAYNWLSDQVKDGWPTSVEDNAFALLALAYDDKVAPQGKATLLGKKTDGGWAGIKQTALALLALSKIGEETTEIEDWLLGKSQTSITADLDWYIQLNTDENTTCEIYYDDYEGKSDIVVLHEDKKVEIKGPISTPKCLSDSSTWWLKISGDSDCLEKTYIIECESYFKASLLYYTKKHKMWFVPSDTKTGDPTAAVKLKIESVCLANDGNCDYEGTAWAAYALFEQGREKDVKLLNPYLVAQADMDVNAKYLPYAFLYLLTEESGYADSLLGLQDKKGFWDTETRSKINYYNTALALLALRSYYGFDESPVKQYLLDHQTSTGSWGGSIRDTAFILYALWPKEVSLLPKLENECATKGYHCRASCIAHNEVEAEEFSDSCEINEVCCKTEEIATECSEEGYKCCTECDPDYEAYGEYNESCGWQKVCCEKCVEIEKEVTECEEKDYKCCIECDPSYEVYPQYDESCSGFAICCEECAKEIEICNNDFDDDGDKLIDCDDPDCASFEKCQPKSKLWLVILLLAAVLIGLYFFLRRRGFKPREFLAKHKLFRRFKKQPPRFGGQPAEVLARPRPFVRGPPFRRPAPAPAEEAAIKTGTEEELEKTLRKLKGNSE